MDFYKLPSGEVAGFDDSSQVPAGATPITAEQFATAATVPVLTLEQAQAAQIDTLNAAYQAAITAPVSYTNAAGATATFNQDSTAKSNLQNALLASQKSQTWPLGLWLDVSGRPITPFTYADLQGLAEAMEAADTPDYQKLLTLIGQVSAATTVEAVQAVVWG